MPQTNPFHSLVPRKMTDTELARAIRLDMEAELDAVNLYEAHYEATDNPEAKAILKHIMDEEKEHHALFLELISRLDPAQKKHLADSSEKYRLIVSGAPHEAVEAVGKEARSADPVVRGLTVGSLSKR